MRNAHSRSAFTLLELLIVIAVIAVLASLMLSSQAGARRRVLASQCLSNSRQFALSLQLYGDDNSGCLPPNRDGEGMVLGETWVEGWLGLPGPDCTNTLYLKRSLLGPYLPTVALWKCPATRAVTVGGKKQTRVRTVSLNCFIGTSVESPSATTYRKWHDFIRPSPSEMISFVEERAETINDGAFSLQWEFRQSQPDTWVLRDQPAVLHNQAGNLGFVDGHAESHRWSDFRRTISERNDQPAPGNNDLKWLQEHATWRAQK